FIRATALASYFRAARLIAAEDASSMGHLGRLVLLLAPHFWLHIRGAAAHSLPACNQQLEFRCNDGSCVSRLNACDGHIHCADGSDEHHCGEFMV
ncbi:hypothetical protein XENORESO_018232, partial [Xenotaenia resolanae]